jgi:hypothetical protein
MQIFEKEVGLLVAVELEQLQFLGMDEVDEILVENQVECHNQELGTALNSENQFRIKYYCNYYVHPLASSVVVLRTDTLVHLYYTDKGSS